MDGSPVHVDERLVWVDGRLVQVDGSSVQVDQRSVQVDEGMIQMDGSPVHVDGRLVPVIGRIIDLNIEQGTTIFDFRSRPGAYFANQHPISAGFTSDKEIFLFIKSFTGTLLCHFLQIFMRKEVIRYNPHLKEVARMLRNNMTLSEILLWQQLKGRKMCGYDFDRQKPIDEFIVDFFCYKLKLAIEIDGASHDYKYTEDYQRQKRLENLGVRFLRFDDLDVKQNLEAVISAIEDWIKRYR